MTQSAQFTQELKSSFAAVIAVSIIVSLIAQINVWRVLGISQQRGQDVANTLLPGLGHFFDLYHHTGGFGF
ncbi:Transporter [Helicobacter bizzozeronii CCUG 35545]|nr:Transporter [Helicobacter bizzozeronii CCUG 35545]